MNEKKKKIGIVVFIILISLTYGVHYYFFMPTITLKGEQTLLLNYKEKYQELGYQAEKKSKDLTNKVKIEGKVNSNQLGVYKIKYFINQGIFRKKVVRTVKVRDLEKPKIYLEQNSSKVYICPNTEYDITKYKAYDNYDGDLTDQVKIIRKKNSIQYAVVDTSGNYRIKKQKIIKKDLEKPTLELNSLDHMVTFLGEDFQDPGYQAYDNCDKNIEKKVKIKGKVDVKKTGSYELVYQLKDSSGNSTLKKRRVDVVKKGQKGTIYLTFDDGPRMGTTNVILDILKEEGVKATFFVTNNGPDELIQREYEEGHTVGLHTASHNYSFLYSSIENYFSDLYSVFDRVKKITGKESRIIRFPGGSSNTISRRYQVGIMSELTKEVLNRNFKYYDWNLNSRDTDGLTSSQDISSYVTTNLSLDRVNIILMHDIKPYTRDALKSIIEYGKQNGYHFEAIDEDTEMMVQKVNN